jgi:hypothetical protein
MSNSSSMEECEVRSSPKNSNGGHKNLQPRSVVPQNVLPRQELHPMAGYRMQWEHPTATSNAENWNLFQRVTTIFSPSTSKGTWTPRITTRAEANSILKDFEKWLDVEPLPSVNKGQQKKKLKRQNVLSSTKKTPATLNSPEPFDERDLAPTESVSDEDSTNGKNLGQEVPEVTNKVQSVSSGNISEPLPKPSSNRSGSSSSGSSSSSWLSKKLLLGKSSKSRRPAQKSPSESSPKETIVESRSLRNKNPLPTLKT